MEEKQICINLNLFPNIVCMFLFIYFNLTFFLIGCPIKITSLFQGLGPVLLH